jgi:hypothetical protein
LKTKTSSIDNIEDFCNLLTPERIKMLNLIFKESKDSLSQDTLKSGTKRKRKLKIEKRSKRRKTESLRPSSLMNAEKFSKRTETPTKTLRKLKAAGLIDLILITSSKSSLIALRLLKMKKLILNPSKQKSNYKLRIRILLLKHIRLKRKLIRT